MEPPTASGDGDGRTRPMMGGGRRRSQAGSSHVIPSIRCGRPRAHARRATRHAEHMHDRRGEGPGVHPAARTGETGTWRVSPRLPRVRESSHRSGVCQRPRNLHAACGAHDTASRPPSSVLGTSTIGHRDVPSALTLCQLRDSSRRLCALGHRLVTPSKGCGARLAACCWLVDEWRHMCAQPGRQVRDPHLWIIPVTAACQDGWLLI